MAIDSLIKKKGSPINGTHGIIEFIEGTHRVIIKLLMEIEAAFVWASDT